MAVLDVLKRRLNISDDGKDELLNDILSDVRSYIVTFCNLDSADDIPETLDGIIVKMAVIDYNRIGTEGLSSESYAGASYGYESCYPDDIKKALYHERLIGVW